MRRHYSLKNDPSLGESRIQDSNLCAPDTTGEPPYSNSAMPPRSYRFSSVWHLFYIGVNQRGIHDRDTITGVFGGYPDAGLIAHATLHFTYIFGTHTSGVLLRAVGLISYFGIASHAYICVSFTTAALVGFRRARSTEEWKRVTDAQQI